MSTVKRGRKRKVVPNVSQRPGVSNPPTAGKRPATLPSQYNFTPAAAHIPPPETPQAQGQVTPQQSTSAAPHFRNFPPPEMLFQNSVIQGREDQHPSLSNPQPCTPHSPLQNSQAQSHPSSQGNNFDPDPVLPELQEDMLRALNALLMVPDRDKFTTVLSPQPLPNTTW